MSGIINFINSPVGPKTVHFWGPAANWGLVGAGALDFNTKPASMISTSMTTTLFFYSCFFMRFAWMGGWLSPEICFYFLAISAMLPCN